MSRGSDRRKACGLRRKSSAQGRLWNGERCELPALWGIQKAAYEVGGVCRVMIEKTMSPSGQLYYP